MTRRAFFELLVRRAEKPLVVHPRVIAADHEAGGEIGWVEWRFPDGPAISLGGPATGECMGWLLAHRGQQLTIVMEADV